MTTKPPGQLYLPSLRSFMQSYQETVVAYATSC